MLEVRMKKGINLKEIPAPYYGKWIYPLGDNWYVIDERYRKYAQENENIEVRKESKIETRNDLITNDKDQKLDLIDNIDKNKENDNNQISLDSLVIEIRDGVWTSSRKKINEINNVDFLRDKLLPELEKTNKTKLIQVTKERIEVLTS